MKVQLIQMTDKPIEVMWTAARTCYASDSPIDIWNNKFGEQELKDGECYSTKHYEECTEKHWKLVKTVLDSGHQSIAEHVYFTFSIEGISRACSHQLVRHRHCTFSQQSQRYVEIKEDLRQLCEYEVHGDIEEIKKTVDKYFTYEHQDEMWACFESLKSYLRLVEKGRKPEDARAVLPNATKTNIVMSCNLRELIHMCNLRLCTRAQYEIRDMFKSIVALVETEDKRIASLLVPQCEAQGFCTEHKCCGRKPELKEVLRVFNTHKDFMDSVEALSERDWKCMGADIENPRVNENLRKFMNTKNEFDENR